MSTTPLAQKMAALEIGNAVRIRRSEVRRAVASLPVLESRQLAITVLFDPEPACEGMALYHLLLSCKGIGPRQASTIPARVPVSQTRRLGDLTGRQKQRLAELLRA